MASTTIGMKNVKNTRYPEYFLCMFAMISEMQINIYFLW